MFGITKRQKIIITSVILSLGLLSTGFLPLSYYLNYKLQIIFGFGVVSYLLSIWALWQGLTPIKAIILMVLPFTFTIAVSSYYFLLPVRWLTRLPIAVVFGLVWYTLLLSQNIFNVSTIRTIPLYRVASTFVLVLTIITASLLYSVIYSLHMLFIWNGIAVLLLSFPLVLQLLWTIEMERLNGLIIIVALFISLVMGEVALAISFWPLSNALASVILTATLYLVSGISMDYLRSRLTREVVWGYLRWGLPVFLVVFLLTSWTT